MKTIRIAALVALIAVICVSFGLVSAVSSSDASATTVFSSSTPKQGQTITVSVTFTNHLDSNLRVFYIGIHGDWMASDGFYGQDLSDDPQTVAAGGSYTADTFTITIPASASLGSHSYYIGVDGLDASSNTFSWNSAEATITVVAGSSGTSGPTGTSNPTNGGTQGNTEEWLPYIAVIAAAAVVAIIVVLTILQKKKRKQPPAATAPAAQPAPEQPKPPAPQPEQPKAEEPKQPAQKPESDQEFTI